MRNISILGSTGSVGRSTLDVVDAFPEALRVVGLAAGGNLDLLAQQVERYAPEIVSVRNPDDVVSLRSRVKRRVEIVCGAEGASAVASLPSADAVIAAIVGAAGIPPVYAALKAGKRVGIANKEVLVAAGDVMTRTAAAHGGEILPVDSEHNAVHQALRCGSHAEVQRIVLTASGGPFLRRDRDTFANITIADALAHPTWKMGNKISIDSATMMNKGLEVIEAHHLFAMPADSIDILIHPQSIVHCLVSYADGSTLAHLSSPDMRTPIAHALAWPRRIASPSPRLDLAQVGQLTFRTPDHKRFRCLGIAVDCMRTGGMAPTILNAANEIAVDAFLNRRIAFLDIPRVVESALNDSPHANVAVDTLEGVLAVDARARELASQICRRVVN